MPLISALIILFLALFANATSKDLLVDENGIGLIKLGMSKKDLISLEKDIKFEVWGGGEEDEPDSCIMAATPTEYIIINNGSIDRVTTTNRKYVTTKGIKVGDSEDDAILAYGKKIKVTNYHWDESNLLHIENEAGNIYYLQTRNKKIENITIVKYGKLGDNQDCD